MSGNSEHLFDSIVLSQSFKRVFAEQYGIHAVNSTVTFRPDGYDVEHTFDSAEFRSACASHSLTPEDMVQEVRLQVEATLNLHLSDAPPSVRH